MLVVVHTSVLSLDSSVQKCLENLEDPNTALLLLVKCLGHSSNIQRVLHTYETVASAPRCLFRVTCIHVRSIQFLFLPHRMSIHNMTNVYRQ